jgi:hypothetical protein
VSTLGGSSIRDASAVRCQSCRREPASESVDDDDPEDPYLVCDGCRRRLLEHALRPREWFHLAARHGWEKYHLCDDFYDDGGSAAQPQRAVEDADAHPFPAREEWQRSFELALEVALVQWHLSDEIIEVLRAAADETSSALPRIVERRNPQFERRAYEIAARALGRRAEAWVRERWQAPGSRPLFALAEASAACLPSPEGLTRVAEAIGALAVPERRDLVIALAWFPDPAALEILERAVMPPHSEAYGRTAACCALSWPVVERWLSAGRPMSLVALDALVCLTSYEGRDPLLTQLAPTLDERPTGTRFEAVLSRYAERDPVPRVERDVAYLLANAHRLVRS